MVRVLMCGSVPPEWGGVTGGGVASVHRILIEEFLSHGHEHGVEIAGLLPFNLDPTSFLQPPVPRVFEAPDQKLEQDFYDRVLRDTRANVVLFQHIAHRWAVYHGRLNRPVPAVGVVHSWTSIASRAPDEAGRVRQTIDAAMSACDCLVFVSEYTRSEGERLGFTYPARTRVIDDPLGMLFTQELPEVANERTGWVFVGSLIDSKKPLIALEAAARCGKHLTIIGTGPEDERLRSTAARLGTEDQVNLVGWAPPERVREALLGAELLCNPSVSEGFGLVYIEALACGTPIIGTGANVEELGKRIGMPCGASIWEGTVEEVAAAALSVHDLALNRSELRRRVVEAFSPKAIATSYVSVLNDAVSGPRT